MRGGGTRGIDAYVSDDRARSRDDSFTGRPPSENAERWITRERKPWRRVGRGASCRHIDHRNVRGHDVPGVRSPTRVQVAEQLLERAYGRAAPRGPLRTSRGSQSERRIGARTLERTIPLPRIPHRESRTANADDPSPAANPAPRTRSIRRRQRPPRDRRRRWTSWASSSWASWSARRTTSYLSWGPRFRAAAARTTARGPGSSARIVLVRRRRAGRPRARLATAPRRAA